MTDWFDELAEKEALRRDVAREAEGRRQQELVVVQQHGRRPLENLRAAVERFVGRYQQRFGDKHDHVDFHVGTNGGFMVRRTGQPAIRLACIPNLETGDIRVTCTQQGGAGEKEQSTEERLTLRGLTPETLHFYDSRGVEYRDLDDVCGLILRPVLFPQLDAG